MRYTLLVIAVLLSASCDKLLSLDANVQSDTSWSGSFDGRTVEGRGNQTVRLGTGNVVRCVAVQKQTRAGYLTVDVDGQERKTTTAEFGVVSACAGGY